MASSVRAKQRAPQEVSKEEVLRHSSHTDAWIILHNKVYDVTSILGRHPGGTECLFDCVGLDGTANFDDVSHSEVAWQMLEPCYVGPLESKSQVHKSSKASKERTSKERPATSTSALPAYPPQHYKDPSWPQIVHTIATSKYTFLALSALATIVYLRHVRWSDPTEVASALPQHF